MVNKQVKSRKRVADHGEVFTNEREVNDMLDLVKNETERIDSRFLEPACGSGNFLVEILQRKLNIVNTIYGKSQNDYERYAIIAISSIYGIDILPDNIIECRNNLLTLFIEAYNRSFKVINSKVIVTADYILNKNIILGDALTLMSVDGKSPIIFSEWSAVNGNFMKRRDFTLAELLKNEPYDDDSLFSDIFDEVFIPEPIKEFDLVHFLKVSEYDE